MKKKTSSTASLAFFLKVCPCGDRFFPSNTMQKYCHAHQGMTPAQVERIKERRKEESE